MAELYFGAYNSQFVEKNLNIIDNFLIPFDIVNFYEKSAIEYAKIKKRKQYNWRIRYANSFYCTFK